MGDAWDLVVILEGREHRLPADGSASLLGSDPVAHLKTAQGPARWALFRYAAGWTVTALSDPVSGEVSLEVEGAARLLSGAASRPAARLDGPGAARLRLRRDGVVLDVDLRLGSAPGSAHNAGTALTIGRSGLGADIQVPGEDVAAQHATVRWDGSRLVLRDLQKGTGTFVEGTRVLRAPLRPGERFVIGHHEFAVGASGELVHQPLGSSLGLRVDDVSVQYPDKDVPSVRGITFDLPHGGLLAVIGPSGIGKSTLCAALLGEAAMVTGRAALGDQPLGGGVPANPTLVSFVPQGGDAMEELTVRDVLSYTGRLRLASDVGAGDRASRVTDVLRRLRMETQAGERVGKLSGGQKRRLSIAMELLVRPLLLLLDEPTSGLDEGLDRHLMTDMAALADEGCTVVVVTHTTAHLPLADRVLAIAGGGEASGEDRRPSVMGYYGPPDGVLAAFAVPEHADVMDALRYGRVAVGSASPGATTTGASAVLSSAPAALAPAKRRAVGSISRWRGFSVSTRRELQRLALRWKYLLGMTVAGPLAVGAVAAYTGPLGLGGSPTHPNPGLGTSLAVVAICVSFLSMALSVTSVVTDLPVIDRERRWGVRPSSVVLSRASVRMALAVVQAVLSGVALTTFRPAPTQSLDGPPSRLGVVVLLCALTVACTCVGILIGAVCVSTEQAVGLMSASLAGMVILCGLVIQLGDAHGFVRVLSALSYLAPTRWGVAALASFIDARAIAPLNPDAMWQQDAFHVLVPVAVLVATSAVALVLATVLLPVTLAHAARR